MRFSIVLSFALLFASNATFSMFRKNGARMLTKQFKLLNSFKNKNLFNFKTSKFILNDIEDYNKGIQDYKNKNLLKIVEDLKKEISFSNEMEKNIEITNNKIDNYFKLISEIQKKSFFKAAAIGNAKSINIFLKNGFYVDELNEHGETPAMIATRFGNYKTLEELLKNGADVNAELIEHAQTELFAAVIFNENTHARKKCLNLIRKKK